ncbi:DUF3857 domain-containing protein [Uliginosibacterium sp. sgz301328]|uniref:DUF3857 domain-containing protein n=1 Tax=Uliginosibacterium sp. sgz301328 TaxID=3243764 RepID=UPI00359D39CA
MKFSTRAASVALAWLTIVFSLSANAQDAAAPVMQTVSIPEQAFARSAQLPPWGEWIDAPVAPTSSSALIMRLGHTQFRYGMDRPQTLVHRAWQVNDASALGYLGQYSIAFQPDYQQLVLHRLTIIRSGQSIDKLATVQVRFVRPQQEADNSIVSGWVSAVVLSDDIRVGDTLDIAYSLIGENPVFGGKVFESAEWDAAIPVVRRVVSIDMPAERKLRYKLIAPDGGAQIQPRESTSAGRRTLRFEAADLPPVNIDEYMPGDVEALRYLQFSEFSEWSQVVDWARGLFTPAPADAEFDRILQKARQAPTAEGKVMAALDFVQNDIRYLALPFGENSHRPFAPHEVLSRRYGDCKDKSLLLVSMLRQMGIDASPVLLATQNRRNLDQMLPSPLDFDHVIVRVRLPSGQEYYLDPTLRAQISPLARIGEAHPDTQVLVIAGGESKLRRTARANRTLMTEVRAERVTAEAFDKPVTMHVTLSFAGLGAESLRRAMTSVTPEQWRKFYEGGLDRRYPRTQLLRAPEVKDDAALNIARVELDYRIENFFEKEGDRWYAPYQASNLRDTFYVPSSGRRTFPLAIPSFPSVIRYEFTLDLPANVDTLRRPAERSVSNPAFVANYQATQRGRQAQASVELEVRADRIAAADTPAFLADIRKVNELAGGAFDFGAADIKTANASAAGGVAYQEAAREQLERIIKGTSDSLAARVLGNSDQARAYCERAMAYAFLDRADEALADVAAARKRLPDDAGIVKCAATVGIVTGDLSGSVNDISRAIALGLADSDSFYRRGLANYLNGKIDDATDDFARSRDLATEANMRNRGEVWRLISLTRAGRATKAPLPAQLDWPGPVIPLFNGTQTPDQMMQGVYANAQGEDLDVLLAEAYFYVGEYYLLRNQTTLAEAYLRRSQDKGAINRLLHYAARQERARLAATRH